MGNKAWCVDHSGRIVKVGSYVNVLVWDHPVAGRSLYKGVETAGVKLESLQVEIIAAISISPDSQHSWVTVLLPPDVHGCKVGKFRVAHQGVRSNLEGENCDELGEWFLNRPFINQRPETNQEPTPPEVVEPNTGEEEDPLAWMSALGDSLV